MVSLDMLKQLRLVMNNGQLERYGEYLLGREPEEAFTDREIAVLMQKKQFYVYKTRFTIEWSECTRIFQKAHFTLIESRRLVNEAIMLSQQMNAQPALLSLTA